MMAILIAACAPSRTPNVATGGSGGISASGGAPSGGGTVGAGGDTTPASGGAAGSTAGGAGGSNGGSGGTGSAPPANIRCTGDADCTSTGQVCEPVTKLCVPCVKTADCSAGAHCLGNKCLSFTPCTSKSDCSAEPICDTTRGVCVQCTKDAECTTNQACNANKCVPVAVCKNNGDCSSNLCDTANSRCLECIVDSHCTGSNVHCLRNLCRPACATNADCTSLGMVCDTSNKVCMQCMTSKDCPASWYCLMNACVPDVCDATQSACNGTSVAGCGTDGDVFDNFTSCTASKPCSVRGAVATCGGVPVGKDAGVSSDGPSSPGDAAVASICAAGTTADLCKTGVPKFSGTQTVDGNGSELCSLPYFTLSAQNAAKVNNYTNAPTSQFETATVRVGWDASGVHLWIEVKDASIQTAYMKDSSQATNKAYLGDSIELFIASSSSVTGLTSKDTNTIHLIIPANGPAVSVKDTGSSGTPTVLPVNQYAQATTGTGYAIEALIPWPGTAPSAGSAVRFDMVLNSADKTFTDLDGMRDGQLVYYLGQVSGSTCQSSEGTLPWCDNRTWCQLNAL
jgi:hypothetical protein